MYVRHVQSAPNVNVEKGLTIVDSLVTTPLSGLLRASHLTSGESQTGDCEGPGTRARHSHYLPVYGVALYSSPRPTRPPNAWKMGTFSNMHGLISLSRGQHYLGLQSYMQFDLWKCGPTRGRILSSVDIIL